MKLRLSLCFICCGSGAENRSSTRSITEAIAAGRDDQTVMTSFLEMRHVCGNAHMDKIIKGLQSEISKKTADFVKKAYERDLRHKRFDDTRYVVEPNVKDGKGGARFA